LRRSAFIIVIGGAVYEHVGVVPVWASAAPASLAMFQASMAITPFRFWMPIHPITMVLLLLALAFNWKTERRNFILTTIVGYAIVLAVTFLYFVPELMSIIQSVYAITTDPELTQRAQSWEFRSQVRLGFDAPFGIYTSFRIEQAQRNPSQAILGDLPRIFCFQQFAHHCGVNGMAALFRRNLGLQRQPKKRDVTDDVEDLVPNEFIVKSKRFFIQHSVGR
jgi:hypothetical protein